MNETFKPCLIGLAVCYRVPLGAGRQRIKKKGTSLFYKDEWLFKDWRKAEGEVK